jgi:hypothetical protein
VNSTVNRIQNKVSRLAFLGVFSLFAFAYLGEFIVLFIPLVITLAGSIISGLLVRRIFVFLLNKRLTSEYRYTNENTTNSEKPFTPPDQFSLYRNLLGLGPRFTGEELKTAYRNNATLYHPDRYALASLNDRQNAEDLMKKVNEAYERLKPAAL